MCGLVALINGGGSVSVATLSTMCAVMAHRGPDGEGFALFDAERAHPLVGPTAPQGGGVAFPTVPAVRVGLGHRRLSIVDTSSAGHQPMADAEGRYWISYNGEIYNHVELRGELEGLGHRFTSHSDTEVLLAAWRQWGEACLARLNGMFAFVLYDRDEDRIIAVRDRFGVKPLYWWRAPDGTLALASEIKAFTVMPGWRAQLDGQMAYDFLVWGLSDHCAHTLFAGVHQVPPGAWFETKVGAFEAPRMKQWFRPAADPHPPATFEEAARGFKEKFMMAVKLRLRADVPVGTALSGGLDSSSIVCAVHDLWDGAGGERNAFSARARDAAFDEGPYMDAVVQQTGVVHHTTWPDADGFLKELNDMIWHHDEPFGSASIYAEWKVFSKVAETAVKVTLDGHGADETLAGYTAFVGPRLADMARHLHMRELVGEWQAQRRVHNRSPLWMLAMMVDDLAPNWLRALLRRVGGRTHPHPAWLDVGILKAQTTDPFASLGERGNGVLGLSLAQLTATSLPMQLKWADRDSMAHSIESREPFLDPQLVSYILGLPDAFKLDLGVTKRVLRAGLSGLLPDVVTNRHDKMGFVTPESLWVTRDRPAAFRDAAGRAVAASKGVLTSAALAEVEAMITGRTPFHTRMIRMITFGLWMERFQVEVS